MNKVLKNDQQRDQASEVLDMIWDLVRYIDQLEEEELQQGLAPINKAIDSQMPKMLSLIGVPKEKQQDVLDMMGDGSPAEEAIHDCMTEG